MLAGQARGALPVVRFRLKKLLPFDADDAAVSYQVMATAKDGVQVLAVAMPREVLADYEGLVREAGFEPGAVLPSTLAALAGLVEGEHPTLVVNAGREGVTTAIVKAGVLLLHRTVDLGADGGADASWARGCRRSGATSCAWRRRQVGIRLRRFVREIALEGGPAATASEVAQAVSVAAAYLRGHAAERAGGGARDGDAGSGGADGAAGRGRRGCRGRWLVREMVGRRDAGRGSDSVGDAGGGAAGLAGGCAGGVGN